MIGAHVDTDTFVAGAAEEYGGKGTVDAAAHGDEDAAAGRNIAPQVEGGRGGELVGLYFGGC